MIKGKSTFMSLMAAHSFEKVVIEKRFNMIFNSEWYYKMACNKRNTTLRYRTKKFIALSLAKPGELTLRVRSPGLTSFVQ